jgi:hypothetical protein
MARRLTQQAKVKPYYGPSAKLSSGNNNGSGTGGYRYSGAEWDDTNPRELRRHNEAEYRRKGWVKGTDGVWRPRKALVPARGQQRT